MKCPCHSGKNYQECCEPYHKGVPAPNALALMRSRYSAYSLGLIDYIIATTHPESSHQPLDPAGLKTFSSETEFTGLEIVSFIDGDKSAFVTFRPHLKQQGKEFSYTEKSSFEKIDGRWFYKESKKI